MMRVSITDLAVRRWPRLRTTTNGCRMTINATYISKGFTADDVDTRYVRAVFGGGYFWCERGSDKRYDIRQGTCEAFDMPDVVREEADKLVSYAFSYVVWPR